ncbi:hypothetical protein LCGC14_0943560 [marine sediment metagenome]|uniref:ABC-2 type transporter domain-containing protein n=1 Tax=marine sediment metagenome TaxID=412755 RepID=A0A0F9NP23_9ZZZZ
MRRMRLDSLNNIYKKIKPVFYTLIFEIRLNMKKVVVFFGVTILLLTFSSYLSIILRGYLPSSPVYFFDNGTIAFMIIIVLAVSLFFGGIICSESKNKTGLEILPLTNRYTLLIGKYLANLILVIGIVVVYYLTMALFSYNFYGGPILYTLLYSFGFAVLYVFALSSIVTFLSSFMPSITPIIVIMSGYILIWEGILSSIIMGNVSELEPLYSLEYLFNIVRSIFNPEFSTMERRNASTGRWLFPSIEGALVFLSLYAIVFFILAALLFKRREF